MNNISAGQWKTANATWPKTYWVANDAYQNPQVADKAHATVALRSNFDNIRQTYAQNKVELFLFKNNAYFNAFYGGADEAELEDWTLKTTTLKTTVLSKSLALAQPL